MIVEIESIMTEEELNDKTYFPDYLVLRQPSDYEEISSKNDEWEGIVKDIKRHMDRQQQLQRAARRQDWMKWEQSFSRLEDMLKKQADIIATKIR